jgi:hypothetical protein
MIWYCFCIDHSILQIILGSILRMQRLAMISAEIHAHPKPLRNNLLAQLALVESQLLSLQDVTINTPTLARSRCNNSVDATGLKLLLQSRLDLALSGKAVGLLLLNTLALLLWLSSLLASLLLTSSP